MQINLTFANEFQERFVLSDKKYVAYVGGLGSAKTHGGAMWLILKALNNRGARLLMAANTNFQLETATLSKVEQLCREWGIPTQYNSKSHVLKFLLPGYEQLEIHCRTLHGKEYEQLAGIEFLAAWIDEAIGTTELAFQRVRERCRQKIYDWCKSCRKKPEQERSLSACGLCSKRKGLPVPTRDADNVKLEDLVQNDVRITTTPSINEARWLYDFLRDAKKRQALLEAGVEIEEINAPSTANKFLPDDYVATLLASYDSEQAKQQVYGEWIVIPEGKPVYGDCFSEAVHLREFKFNPERPLIIGFDWGYHHPAAIFAQEDEMDRLWILGELIKTNVERELFLESVWHYINMEFLRGTKLTANDLKLECYCDPAGKQKTDASKKSTVRLAREMGFQPLYPAKKLEVSEGVMLARRRFSTLIEGIPAVVVHKYNCPTFTEGLKGGYHYSVVRDGNAEKTEPHKDGYYEHPQDAFRYIIVGKYHRGKRPTKGNVQHWKPIDPMTGY